MIKCLPVDRLVKSIGLILLGIALGYLAHWPKTADRFVWDKDGTYALDKKTGQMCVPAEAGRQNDAKLPICLDIYKHY